MTDAKGQLDDALSLMRDLTDSARRGRAHVAEIEQQREFLEQHLDGLSKSIFLASAPDGIALTSGHRLQLAARSDFTVNAGGSADIGVLKKFTVAAGEAISLFARTLGVKLFAARGKVEIQAQTDEVALTAFKDLKIISTDGKLILAAKKEVWIGAGGSYIKITSNGIENGTLGDIRERCASWDVPGPASKHPVLPTLPNTVCVTCLLRELSQGALLGTK